MQSTLILALLFLPLVGAGFLGPWPVPSRAERAVRILQSWLFPAILTTQVVLVMIGASRGTPTWAHALASPWLGEGPLAIYARDSLAVSLQLLVLFLPLAVMSLARARMTTRRLPGSVALVLVSCGVAATSAQTLFAACLAWGAADLILIATNLLNMQVEGFTHITRRLWANLASTCLLVAAASLRGGDNLIGAGLIGTARDLALVAAILRLGVYLVPGSARLRWQATLFALAAGGGLVIRLASTATGGPIDLRAAATLGGWGMLAVGFVAARSVNLREAFPYLALHGSMVAVVAAMGDPFSGMTIALASLVNAGLCLTMSQVLPSLWPRQIPRIGQWLWALIVASAAGIPFTLGFLSHWGLLRIYWLQGTWWPLCLTCLSYALASVPLWRHGRSIAQVAPAERPTGLSAWIAIGGSILLGLCLVLPGLHPPLLFALSGRPSPTLLGLGTLLHGPLTATLGLLLLGALSPLAGLALVLVEPRLEAQATTVLDTVGALLATHWLYDLVEAVLETLRRGMEIVAQAIDGSLYLGWVIAWSIILILGLG